jgi:hypothetical protein
VSRSLAPVAFAAGALHAVAGTLALAFGQETVFVSVTDYVLEWVFVGALVLSTWVLFGLARVSADRAARVACAVAAVGHAAMLVAATATAVAGRESLDALFPLGVLLTIVGFVGLAVQDLRRRVMPAHAGLVLAAAFVLAIPADALLGAGSLVLAAGWLALGRLLSGSRELASA